MGDEAKDLWSFLTGYQLRHGISTLPIILSSVVHQEPPALRLARSLAVPAQPSQYIPSESLRPSTRPVMSFMLTTCCTLETVDGFEGNGPGTTPAAVFPALMLIWFPWDLSSKTANLNFVLGANAARIIMGVRLPWKGYTSHITAVNDKQNPSSCHPVCLFPCDGCQKVPACAGPCIVGFAHRHSLPRHPCPAGAEEGDKS